MKKSAISSPYENTNGKEIFLNLRIMKIKILLFILLLQTMMLASAQINSLDGISAQYTKPSLPTGLTGSRPNQKSRLPLPAYLHTVDDKSLSGSIQSISDSAIIFSAKGKGKSGESNNMEISYSNIREIKIRKKNGIIKGFLYGTGVGLLPIIGGAIIGKGEGGAYVSVITLPLGIITGTLIGSSRKKFNINGSASSFYDFKKRME